MCFYSVIEFFFNALKADIPVQSNNGIKDGDSFNHVSMFYICNNTIINFAKMLDLLYLNITLLIERILSFFNQNEANFNYLEGHEIK